MAIFEITEGAPGQGKSLYTARLAERLCKRNAKWYIKNEGRIPVRKVASNIKFAQWFEDEYREFIHYWQQPEELLELRDCDVLWDEIATELDSRNFANLSQEMKRFLSQYRKRGVDIYANTQDFSMIDARARLMVTNVFTLSKIIGSGDLSTTKPPPRFIWGFIMIRQVLNFKETEAEKKKYGFIPSFMMIERRLTEMYDTRQDIPQGAPPRLKHKIVYCEHYGKMIPDKNGVMRLHDCQYHKIIHD